MKRTLVFIYKFFFVRNSFLYSRRKVAAVLFVRQKICTTNVPPIQLPQIPDVHQTCTSFPFPFILMGYSLKKHFRSLNDLLPDENYNAGRD